MTREIEYRAYCKSKGEIRDVVDIYFGKKQEVQSVRVLCEHDGMSYPSDDIYVDDFILLQYTGIKDKNGTGLAEVYEGDIISENGMLKGNIYEIDKRETDIVVPQLGTKAWEATYKEIVARGYDYSE